MKTALLRLKAFPKTEARLRARVRKTIARARAAEPDLAALWSGFRHKRPSGMRRADYVKLRVLHRQFEGERPTGLPTLVRAARFLVKRMWKREKSR